MATAIRDDGLHVRRTAVLAYRPRRRTYDKDVLRVGTWLVGGRRWDVTARTLRRLVLNFQQARQRGIRIPVVWNHSHDARDKIGEVVRLYVSGKALRAVFWAADACDARQLENAACEMSVEVAEPWVDGLGRVYDLFLTHLAVVNHPVVSRQGPLRRLSMQADIAPSNESQRGEANMTENGVGVAERTEGEVDAPAIARLVNEIVSSLGASLTMAEDASAEGLVDRLRELRDRIDALVGAEIEPSLVSASLEGEATVESLQGRLEQVTRQLALERRRAREDRARSFEKEVDRLIGEGRLAAADKAALVETGKTADYSLSLLSPFQRIPLGAAVPTVSLTRRSATAKPPAIGRERGVDEARAEEIVNNFR